MFHVDFLLLSDFRNNASSLPFRLKVCRIVPFILLLKVVLKIRLSLSIGGIILTEENRPTRRKICPNAALPTTNPTHAGLGLNPDLRGERPATDRFKHRNVLKLPAQTWTHWPMFQCSPHTVCMQHSQVPSLCAARIEKFAFC